ncbi:JmjC domain-containing protein [Enhygromyxa salina]|uniref:Cupin superfamily protein n=1 Tax=Enhygromyxa salina TaxID=215803 RepID=A0A2S9XPZ1_9BACT|nr:cupin domain-containing protein [Enhygromyxa salina]PRP94810.1 Cupin superfamily protein [Enhygromyxa salina]
MAEALDPPSILGALLGSPTRSESFVREHWPGRPFVAEGALADWAALFELEQLVDPSAALTTGEAELARLQLGRDEVTFTPERVGGGRRLSERQVSGALSLYQAGMQLYLEKVVGFPRLTTTLRRLADELGIARTRVACNLFAVREGSPHTPPLHWDNSEGLVVQLAGRKRWQYAPNTCVPNPPFNHFGGASPSLEQVLLFDHAREPEALDSVVLEPGSVLFLPRGYWHTTTPLSDSVHLDIMLEAPTWGGLLRAIVERVSLEQPQLRAPIETGSLTSATLLAELAAHRRSLEAELAGLRPIDLLLGGLGRDAGLLADVAAFELRPGVRFEWRDDGDGVTLVVYEQDAVLLSIRASSSAPREVLAWIGARASAFDLAQLRARFLDRSDSELCAILRVLWTAEILEVVASPSSASR